jgi:hypothetical protein
MSVRLNNFSVEIVSNNVKKINRNGHNYIALPHHSEYKLRLTNDRSKQCDAVITIDGEVVGSWRVPAYGSIMIERPSHSQRKFVFVNEISGEAYDGEVNVGQKKNGLVSITFKPEKEQEAFLQSFSCNELYGSSFNNYTNELRGSIKSNKTNRCSIGSSLAKSKYTSNDGVDFMNCSSNSWNSPNNLSTGATILGGSSSQRFGKASRITNYDYDNETIINLRMLVNEDSWPQFSKPYAPLRARSHVIQEPPRIEKIQTFPYFNF